MSLISENHFGINSADMKTSNKIFEAFNRGVAKEVHRQTVREFPEVFGDTKAAPEKTVIGNTAVRDIANKFFIKMSPDKAQETAAILDKNGVKFGGVIRDGKATITIDKADLERYQSLTSLDPPKTEKQTEIKTAKLSQEKPAVPPKPKRDSSNLPAKKKVENSKAEHNEEQRPSLLGAIEEIRKSSEQSTQSLNEIEKEL